MTIPAGAVVQIYSPAYGTTTVGTLACPVGPYNHTAILQDTEGHRARFEGIITLVDNSAQAL